MAEERSPQDEIQHMSVAEFRAQGYLQELNRQFLHPLGLALEVAVDGNGNEWLSGIEDFRHDPEGMCYADGNIDAEKAQFIMAQMRWRAIIRELSLGYHIQPPFPIVKR